MPWNMICSVKSEIKLQERLCGFRKPPKPWRLLMYLLPLLWWQNATIMSARRSMNKGVIDIKEGRHPVVEKMIDQ